MEKILVLVLMSLYNLSCIAQNLELTSIQPKTKKEHSLVVECLDDGCKTADIKLTIGGSMHSSLTENELALFDFQKSMKFSKRSALIEFYGDNVADCDKDEKTGKCRLRKIVLAFSGVGTFVLVFATSIHGVRDFFSFPIHFMKKRRIKNQWNKLSSFETTDIDTEYKSISVPFKLFQNIVEALQLKTVDEEELIE